MRVYGLAAVLALTLATVGCSSKTRFVYALGPSTNSVLGFQESVTGGLTELTTSPFSTDSQPVSMVIHPSGIFAYVANFSGGNVSIFARDTKGTLTPATDPITNLQLGPITVGTDPIAVALTPGGQFLYTLNQGTTPAPGNPAQVQASISAFTVDNTTGNLTAVTGSFLTPPAATSLVVSMAIAPNGNFLYVVDSANATVDGFLINSTNGSLTALAGSPFPVGSSPAFAIVDPQDKFLYVADQALNDIFAFTINSNTGALSPMSGSPFAAGSAPVSLAIDSAGVLLMAANEGSNNVSGYSINTSTGALSPLSGSPFATGTAPAFVTVDATDSFVYVADSGSHDISAFTLTGGTLQSIAGSPFSVANSPTWLTSR